MSKPFALVAVVLLAFGSGCKTVERNPAFKGGVNEKYVYIVGETKVGDGRFAYEPGMTVQDLITQRGGITTRGVSFKVRVYRPSEDKTIQCKINYDKVAKGDVSQNIVLQGGDIVYVPKTITTVLYDGFKALFPPWDDMMGASTRFIEVYGADKSAP